jgi:hypothetical protein
MSLALILLLQSAAPASPASNQAAAPPAKLIPVDFDLKEWRPSESCGAGSSDEIIVCGQRPDADRYRVGPVSSRFDTEPLVAEMGIGGGATARAYAESVEFPGGFVSKRIMVGIKLPF